MRQSYLAQVLSDLPLGGLRYFEVIGSTNDEAARWVEQGAPDFSLVIADEQTAGRGRLARSWFTPPGAALAFSLILRPSTFPSSPPSPGFFTALGALAVSDALRNNYGLATEIKWPNDVLAGQRKLAGVLAEAQWRGEELTAVILGIGINVAPSSVPPESEILFPATCVETALGYPIARWELLCAVLQSLIHWRPLLNQCVFLQSWEERLAFRGAAVEVSSNGETQWKGILLGLNSEGALRLRTSAGTEITVHVGDVRLRLESGKIG
jgi:BirA family biotin operon repressor/biotin-[acetyl-CoA-carboxylase] ligase